MHKKKMIAPVVITLLLLAYYLFYFTMIINTPMLPSTAKLLGGVIPLLLAGGSVYVLMERIKEIRSGEEDDLSQY